MWFDLQASVLLLLGFFASTYYTLPMVSSQPLTLNRLGHTTIRGVNLGGWLILEDYLNHDLLEGVDPPDQYHFDLSVADAATKLRHHWESYYKEEDFRDFARWGLNSLRIPIGYWAFVHDDTPYIRGAVHYLDKAIIWARKHGLWVLIDLHGLPGSQNGFGHSGVHFHPDDIRWQTEENLNLSKQALKMMATKYGSAEYADVVVAIEMANEPIDWGANTLDATQKWAKEAYHVVVRHLENENLRVVMHDSFEDSWHYIWLSEELNEYEPTKARFVLDTHKYQDQTDESANMSSQEHLDAVCDYVSDFRNASMHGLPIVVGEFNGGINICLYKDGREVAGNSCNESGCQCSATTSIHDYNRKMRKYVRRYIEAQMYVFERYTQGWMMWTGKALGGWGFNDSLAAGLIPQPLGSFEYGPFCFER